MSEKLKRRQMVIDLYSEGLTQTEVAKAVGMSTQGVCYLLNRYAPDLVGRRKDARRTARENERYERVFGDLRRQWRAIVKDVAEGRAF